MALGMLVGQQFGHLSGALRQRGQIDDDGRGAFTATAQRFQQRDAVIAAFGVCGLEHVAGHAVGQLQDLTRVAVVNLQDSGAARSLDANALEAEVLLVRSVVDALRIVVEQQQAVGGRSTI